MRERVQKDDGYWWERNESIELLCNSLSTSVQDLRLDDVMHAHIISPYRWDECFSLQPHQRLAQGSLTAGRYEGHTSPLLLSPPYSRRREGATFCIQDSEES